MAMHADGHTIKIWSLKYCGINSMHADGHACGHAGTNGHACGHADGQTCVECGQHADGDEAMAASNRISLRILNQDLHIL